MRGVVLCISFRNSSCISLRVKAHRVWSELCYTSFVFSNKNCPWVVRPGNPIIFLRERHDQQFK